MNNLLVISIKPEYMSLILSGQKSVELRKCRPSIAKEDILIALYCTAPVKAIVGFCLLEDLSEGEPELIWNKFSRDVGIDKTTFFHYYSNNEKAFGLHLSSIYTLENCIPLDVIKEKIPNFSPPQTYRYYNLNQVKRKFKKNLHKDYFKVRSLVEN